MGRLTGARRVCGTVACGKLAIARGLCGTCYHRWWMTQPQDLSASVKGEEPNPEKLLRHRQRNRQYRQHNLGRAQASAAFYALSDAGQAARRRANERSKAWAKTLRFLNRETPEAIAQKFPCLQDYAKQLVQYRPVSRTSIQKVLPEKVLLELRRISLNCVRYS